MSDELAVFDEDVGLVHDVKGERGGGTDEGKKDAQDFQVASGEEEYGEAGESEGDCATSVVGVECTIVDVVEIRGGVVVAEEEL